jgi:hypothetical protein
MKCLAPKPSDMDMDAMRRPLPPDKAGIPLGPRKHRKPPHPSSVVPVPRLGPKQNWAQKLMSAFKLKGRRRPKRLRRYKRV